MDALSTITQNNFTNVNFVQVLVNIVIELFLHIFYIRRLIVYWGEKGARFVQKWAKKSRFYTGSGGFLCVSQTGGLAEQWSGKIKSVGKVAVLM